MTKGRLILVRHGESEGNRARRFTLTPDVPVTDLGAEQAREAGRKIAAAFDAARIVASPFRRAQQTAELIAEHVPLPIETEPELRERHFGVYVGKPYDTVFDDPTYDGERRWEWTPEGGESLIDVQNRVVPAVLRIAESSPAEDVVVVSHGGVMATLMAHFRGHWENLRVASNCGIIVVPHDGRTYGEPEPHDVEFL